MIKLFASDWLPIPGLFPVASFDHLVGAGEERGRDGEAEGFAPFSG